MPIFFPCKHFLCLISLVSCKYYPPFVVFPHTLGRSCYFFFFPGLCTCFLSRFYFMSFLEDKNNISVPRSSQLAPCVLLWNESELLSLSVRHGVLLRWICCCSVVPRIHSDFSNTGCSLKNWNTLPPPSLLALSTLWSPGRCKMRDLSACRFYSRCLSGPPCRR